MTYEFERLANTVGMIKRHPYYPGKELLLDECLEDIDDRYRRGRLTAEQRGRLRGHLAGARTELTGSVHEPLSRTDRPDLSVIRLSPAGTVYWHVEVPGIKADRGELSDRSPRSVFFFGRPKSPGTHGACCRTGVEQYGHDRASGAAAPGETRLGGEFATSPGGKGANQAVAARRAGADVVFVAALGDDALGRGALALYEKEGLDVRHARLIAGVRSGVALIFVGEGGENMIGVAPGANAHLAPAGAIDALPASLFTPGAILLASLEVPFATVVRGLERARAGGMTTVLNPAPIDPAILDPEVLALVDVLTPNHEEARALVRDARPAEPRGVVATALEAVRLLRSRGVHDVVVTLGPKGCLVAEEAGCQLVAAPTVEAVDTVGAGDAFNGALAVALAEGRPLVVAAAWACAAGALAVTRPGAQGALPRRWEIDWRAFGAPPPRIVRHNRP